jgi:hypothetical protein
MSTYTQRKKLSKGTWALIIVIFAAIIGVAVAALLGYIDLTPYADGYVSIFMWGATNIYCSLILTLGFMALGGVLVYLIYNYFRGQKVTVAAQGAAYTPQGQTLSQPQTGTSTEVS